MTEGKLTPEQYEAIWGEPPPKGEWMPHHLTQIQRRARAKLRAGGPMHALALAVELGVTPNAVLRALDELAHYGIVEALSGPPENTRLWRQVR